MIAEQCHGVVLSTLAYGENDLVVSLFTLEHGRLRAFARSARKSRKRFAGSLEAAARLELSIAIKQEGLCRLDRADQVIPPPGLGSRLDAMALAMYGCELVELLTPEGLPLPRLYRLLSSLLDHTEQQGATQADRRFFEINLLNVLGYLPLMTDPLLAPLRRCLSTGRFGTVAFSPDQLHAAGRLLDRELDRHCPRQRKSLEFLEGVICP